MASDAHRDARRLRRDTWLFEAAAIAFALLATILLFDLSFNGWSWWKAFDTGLFTYVAAQTHLNARRLTNGADTAQHRSVSAAHDRGRDL